MHRSSVTVLSVIQIIPDYESKNRHAEFTCWKYSIFFNAGANFLSSSLTMYSYIENEAFFLEFLSPLDIRIPSNLQHPITARQPLKSRAQISSCLAKKFFLHQRRARMETDDATRAHDSRTLFHVRAPRENKIGVSAHVDARLRTSVCVTRRYVTHSLTADPYNGVHA